MVRILRWVGWILLLGAVASLASDAIASINAGTVRLRPMRVLWSDVSPSTLDALQGAVQSLLGPSFWNGVVAPVLGWPTPIVLGLPGILLLILLPKRRRR